MLTSLDVLKLAVARAPQAEAKPFDVFAAPIERWVKSILPKTLKPMYCSLICWDDKARFAVDTMNAKQIGDEVGTFDILITGLERTDDTHFYMVPSSEYAVTTKFRIAGPHGRSANAHSFCAVTGKNFKEFATSAKLDEALKAAYIAAIGSATAHYPAWD